MYVYSIFFFFFQVSFLGQEWHVLTSLNWGNLKEKSGGWASIVARVGRWAVAPFGAKCFFLTRSDRSERLSSPSVELSVSVITLRVYLFWD